MLKTDALPPLPDLEQCLWALVAQVPAGRVTTYGDVAKALGDVAAARWVGEVLVRHPHKTGCPCHRVIRSTGDIGLFAGESPQQKALQLVDEGVAVRSDRVPLKDYRWSEFHTDRPLKLLKAAQQKLHEELRLAPLDTPPQLIGSVDVAYVGNDRAVAAIVLCDAETMQPVWETTLVESVRFPYIPGYLTFREAPLLLKLVEAASAESRLPDLWFVDGNGILHPRRCGIATAFGTLVRAPTIGIGKKLLCGRVTERNDETSVARLVEHNGEIIGAAMSGSAARKPVYASPGWGVEFSDVIRITAGCFRNHRTPEPIYLADRLSKLRAADVRKTDKGLSP